MDVSQLRTLIAGTALVDVEACRRELEDLRVLRGLSDAREVEVLTRLDELTVDGAAIYPEDELAKATKSSLTKGVKIRHRKEACEHVPSWARRSPTVPRPVTVWMSWRMPPPG